MQMPMCTRCGKRIAMVFITKMDQNQNTTQEGLCLQCARELGIEPLDDMMKKMGINEEMLEMMSEQMMSMEDLAGMMPVGMTGEESDFDEDDTPDMLGMPPLPFAQMMEVEPVQNSAKDGEIVPTADEKEAPRAPRRERRAENRKNKRKFLETYCENLTQKATEGRIDAIIGREAEIARVIQILNRRQKNNPCLIGEPGVGKTAVAEGLATRIAEGNVPFKLLHKEVHLLDLTAMVAGTQFRGQFESRMKGLMEEVKREGNIILVIDEVHNIVGTGDSEGSMNAANILKPALSRGELQVIGATTFAEYRKYIEKDAALERRFQPVTVNEPSIADTAKMLEGVRGYYEDYHGVTVPTEICLLAAQLSERYITDRFLPDKAIDLLDEACSRLNLDEPVLAEVPVLRLQLEQIATEKEALLTAPQEESTYAALATLRSRELQMEQRLEELDGIPAPVLTPAHLAAVIEVWTGIPAAKVQSLALSRLRDMPARLGKQVIGQQTAIDAICAAMRRARTGISPKRKPVSLLFVGPTGVGKTELVKTLATDLFDTPEALIRLDMSEYMEKHAVSRLIGSPPGYVGYDEAGQLTEKIRRRPYAVILLDEIEKAHPDILNILLQILDDGHIADAHGRSVNFENTVIVMTSNAGSERRTNAVGFGATTSELGKDRAMKALEGMMRPEFLNRIDEIVPFNSLSHDDFKQICTLLLTNLQESAAKQNLRVTWDDSLCDYLVKKGYSDKYGARNLRRMVEKECETALANAILDAEDSKLLGAHLTSDGERVCVQSV